MAIYIITSHKKGISSLQLAKDLHITQKSAWFMLERIRKCFNIENYHILDNNVEIDETYIGGKNEYETSERFVALLSNMTVRTRYEDLKAAGVN